MGLDSVIFGILLALVMVLIANQRKYNTECFNNGEERTMLNHQLDMARGMRSDGFRQEPAYRNVNMMAAHANSGASVNPSQIARAEQEQWMMSHAYDAEKAFSASSDDVHGGKDMDYGSYVTNLIVDPRTASNHKKWVDEMKPWSGTATTVDDLEEAMEATTNFVGLRRPQPIVQYNPLQLTEQDSFTFISNPKFNFRG